MLRNVTSKDADGVAFVASHVSDDDEDDQQVAERQMKAESEYRKMKSSMDSGGALDFGALASMASSLTVEESPAVAAAEETLPPPPAQTGGGSGGLFEKDAPATSGLASLMRGFDFGALASLGGSLAESTCTTPPAPPRAGDEGVTVEIEFDSGKDDDEGEEEEEARSPRRRPVPNPPGVKTTEVKLQEYLMREEIELLGEGTHVPLRRGGGGATYRTRVRTTPCESFLCRETDSPCARPPNLPLRVF
jgi:hypothetical protein